MLVTKGHCPLEHVPTRPCVEPVTVAIATQGGFVEHGYPHVSNPAVRAKPTEVGDARQEVNRNKIQRHKAEQVLPPLPAAGKGVGIPLQAGFMSVRMQMID